MRVKPALFGLLCAWREVLILRQHILTGFIAVNTELSGSTRQVTGSI
jgi:hypothetical protein